MKARKHPTGMVIPHHRLPPGFTDSIGRVVAEPVTPSPAATVVLLRDGATGPEALLLLRQRRTGFVPGAYVFPGGCVDRADDDERLSTLTTGALPPEPPRSAWVAAARELFEETGVLLARTMAGAPSPDAETDRDLRQARQALLKDGTTVYDMLVRRNLRLDFSRVVYFGHWITPVVEPRRFDTRFFLAELPAGQRARHDPREMDAATWLTPAAALARFHAGTLPMVFPTVHSLELIDGFASVAELLDAFRGCPVQTVLPRLANRPDGVELIVDPEVS